MFKPLTLYNPSVRNLAQGPNLTILSTKISVVCL